MHAAAGREEGGDALQRVRTRPLPSNLPTGGSRNRPLLPGTTTKLTAGPRLPLSFRLVFLGVHIPHSPLATGVWTRNPSASSSSSSLLIKCLGMYVLTPATSERGSVVT